MEHLTLVEHPWNDYVYWHPKHLAFSQALKDERDAQHLVEMHRLQQIGTPEAHSYELMHEELLGHEALRRHPEQFEHWWKGLEPDIRAHLMESYEKGLDLVRKEGKGGATAFIQKLMRERSVHVTTVVG